MTTIRINQFSGEVPNLPKYLLPDFNAQQAIYCDFAQKDLRPLHQGLSQIATFPATIKGLYTEDGANFYTWSTETAAYKSPVIGEAFSRVYFMNASGFKVTVYSPPLSHSNGTNGQPASSWDVGVPTPNNAPVLTTVDKTTLRGYSAPSVSAVAWYELTGKRYDTTTSFTPTIVTAFKKYSFTPPTRGSNTPAEAVLYVQFTMTDSGKDIFTVAIPSGSNGARTSALPGGIELFLTDAGVITLNWGVYETRAYTYTYVNTWNEESGPAPAATIDVTYMQDVQVAFGLTSFGSYRPYSTTNIYRTFGTSSNYVKVGTSASTPVTDLTYKASDIGASLPSLEWVPPVSGMTGMVALPNGVFAAFKDNRVYFSEPYRPHTWQYSMTFPYNVRGICVGSQALVVTTANAAYMVVGSTPKNMQQIVLPTPQAGLSHRSMTLIEGAVAFASNDGIVLVNGSQATMDISQKFWSREDWRSRYSGMFTDMRFAYHDGFLVVTSATQAKGFLVRLDEAAGTLSEYNQSVDATFYMPLLDTLYYSIGSTLYEFRGNTSYHTLDWWSKDFILGLPVNFGAGYIRCSGSVTITLYADGAQWYQVTVSGAGYFRLPAGKKALKWSIRLQTSAVVEEIVLAEAMSELRSV